MEKENSQRGAQLFDSEQEGKEAHSEMKSSMLRNHHLYIGIYFVYALNRYRSNDV